jgi:hypothetical protein
MTRGENWKRFFTSKGWITDDVISAGEGETLKICIRQAGHTEDKDDCICESALIMEEDGVLCHESRTGTVFFQWDDIVRVKLEDDKKKKGWL